MCCRKRLSGLAFGDVVDQFGLRPSFGLQYSAEFLDGYTEGATAAPLTVGDRTNQGLTGFSELAFVTVRHGSEGQLYGLEVRVGAESRQLLGDDSIDATLIGTSLMFEPAVKKSTVDGNIGLGVQGTMSDSVVVFADLKGRKGSETASALTGKAGVKWVFH